MKLKHAELRFDVRGMLATVALAVLESDHARCLRDLMCNDIDKGSAEKLKLLRTTSRVLLGCRDDFMRRRARRSMPQSCTVQEHYVPGGDACICRQYEG